MNDNVAIGIYDFETVIPDGVAAIFRAAGFTVYTLSSDPEIQKARPRVDIVYRHRGNAPGPRLAKLSDGTQRVSAFIGELFIYAITDCDPPGKRAHSVFRARVRDLLAQLPYLLSTEPLPLPYHKIYFPPVSETEDHGLREKDGFEQTSFSWTFNFCVRETAWALLETTP